MAGDVFSTRKLYFGINHVLRYISELTILFLLTVHPHGASGQFDNSAVEAEMDCQQKLMEETYICVSNHDIDFNLFLLMVSEAKDSTSSDNSTEPAVTDGSNSTEFRDKVCSAREDIMKCTFDAAKSLIKTPSCANSADGNQGDPFKQDLLINDQRYLIKEQMEAIIGQYDVFCAHPCRISLLDDMRKCYEDYELDPKIFMSTKSNGPVIGSDSYEVDLFCKNREPLVECLEKIRDECPESNLVLSAVGLDLEYMERGFSVLCEDTESYLNSLECFESHSTQVGICYSVKYREVITLASKAHKETWSSEKYFEEICGVNIRYIDCDMKAWADKDDKKCEETTLVLKRKLHCALLPKQCESTHQKAIADVCNPKKSSILKIFPSPFLLFITYSLAMIVVY